MSLKKLLTCGFIFIALFAVMAAPVSAEDMLGNQIGWITFHTNVDGATIYVNGNAAGTTVNQVYTYTVYLDGSPSSMPTNAYAAKSGYQNSNTQTLATPSAGETLNYYMTLNPTGPTTGSIYVTSSPSNAMVYIDGTYVGNTPQQSSGYSAGYHNVEVRKSGYQNWASSASVTAGATANVYASLVAVESYGTISVRSTPSGASVYLDGNYQGQTPTTVSGVVKGAHTIELNKAGYNEWVGQVTVYAGQTSTIYPTLQAIPTPGTGTIYVSSSPGGAYLYLDGTYEGVTPTYGTSAIDNVNAGTHTITLKLSGYKDATTSVSVIGGGTATVSLPLTPQGSSVTTGTLSLSSTPTGANVFINNEYKGITPFSITLDAGQYSVTFRLPGYTDSTTTATVNAGATSTIQGSLVPTSQPTQSGSFPVAIFGGIFIAGLLFAALKVRKE
ncbi:MAG: PEGA domain-containing protein [Methanomicrobiaceae archaeon]|nr:PEGA domain-containing protein [Methanomicrobiaceae archaeon]